MSRRVALRDFDMARDRPFGDALAVRRYDPIPERAVDDVIRPRLKPRPDGLNRIAAERNEVRIAPHKTDKLTVGGDLQEIAGQQGAFLSSALRPMHHRATLEMASGANERQAGKYL